MLHTYAEKLAAKILEKEHYPENRKPILVYGTELALSTLSSVLSILVLSFLLGDILSGVIFLALFISIRLFAGGFHANTYHACFIVTNSVFLAVFGLSRLLTLWDKQIALLTILGVSGTIIFCLTPVRNHNHPLSESTYQKNKRISRILLFCEIPLIIFIYALSKNTSFLSISALSLAAIAVMMIIPKLERRV